MVSVRATAERTVEFYERPTPELGPNQILIRSSLSGVSAGTEMAVYLGKIPNLYNGRWGYWNSYPIGLGYEMAGVVEKAGVDVTKVRKGDRVIALCNHGDYGISEAYRCTRIPDGVSDENSVFAVLGATTTHGIRRAGVVYGERILVLGFGTIGMLAAFHCRRAGAEKVIIADPVAEKRESARRKGFERTLDPSSDTFEEEVLSITDGMGADLVVEGSGHPSAWIPAQQAAKIGGRILILGTHTGPEEMVFCDYVMHKELTIIGTWANGRNIAVDPQFIRWNGESNLSYAMDLIDRGELSVDGMISHRFSFRELPDIYRQIEDKTLGYQQIVLTYP